MIILSGENGLSRSSVSVMLCLIWFSENSPSEISMPEHGLCSTFSPKSLKLAWKDFMLFLMSIPKNLLKTMLPGKPITSGLPQHWMASFQKKLCGRWINPATWVTLLSTLSTPLFLHLCSVPQKLSSNGYIYCDYRMDHSTCLWKDLQALNIKMLLLSISSTNDLHK